MSRRLLIVTSSYRPTMIADMQRTRMLAWELGAQGWEVEVLCPDARFQPPPALDRDSEPFFAPQTRLHEVAPRWQPLFSMLTVGTIGLRALVPVLLAGLRLLKERRFDLVYFSTAQFSLFLCGPAWRKLGGVPYVLDFHDPCVRRNPAAASGTRPGLKRWLSRQLAKVIEWTAVRPAAGIVSVSPNYLDDLRQRYAARAPAWTRQGRAEVIPFAASERDLAVVAGAPIRASDDARRVAYVGVGGPVMERSFRLLCSVLARALQGAPTQAAPPIRFELFGTMLWWKEGDPRHLQGIADAAGLGGSVFESPARVSYRRALELQSAADGLLILGVDDDGYMPSKLFSVALAGTPILGCLRRASPGFQALRGLPLAHAIWFDESGHMPMEEAVGSAREFLRQVAARSRIDRRAHVAPHSAAAMAKRHADLFERCLRPPE